MKSIIQELAKSSSPEGMYELLNQTEISLKTRNPIWSDFVSAPLREEAFRLIEPINDFSWVSNGGYSSSERHRMLCIRTEDVGDTPLEISAPLAGLKIEGNFLFDRATPQEFRIALHSMGIKPSAMGDLWLIGDRGAEAICTPEGALLLNQKKGIVRNVEICCEKQEVSDLQLPMQRKQREFSTVESSTRIDALASAGFGISRAKAVSNVKEGKLRLNWKIIKQQSKELKAGDRIHLEGKGTIEVISIDITKRQRLRVKLLLN